MQPFTLLIKPSGSDCNIDCAYCFYKGRDPVVGTGRQRMGGQVLERLVSDYMQLGFPVAGLAWQGGEPTLMGVDFFRRAVELQKRYGEAGQQLSNTMQTNAVLLDDRWCSFLHENKFLLGISIDGPEEFQNQYRLDMAGKGTYGRVMRGIQCCQEHDVQFSTLVLLNNKNVEHADVLIEFLLEHDMTYVQFIPCIEIDPATGGPAEFSITPGQYGDFLCEAFDLWWKLGPEKINIRDFDSLVTHYVMGRHTICAYSRRCAGFVVVEHNGDAFCCEFFVEPRWRLGNILETPLAELAQSPIKKTFARRKEKLAGKCFVCPHLDICRGGCMKDRFGAGQAAPAQPSYFCESYKHFFSHALARVMQLAATITAGNEVRRVRPADKVRLHIE